MVTVLTSGCALQRQLTQPDSGLGLIGKSAPSFSGTDLDGKPIQLADFTSHPVVINFWASWCGPCRAEQPAINRVAVDYKPKGVEVIGIDIRDNLDPARIYRDEFKMPYRSLFDQAARVAYGYQVDAPPSSVFIDAKGAIVYTAPGALGEDNMRKLIDSKLLGTASR